MPKNLSHGGSIQRYRPDLSSMPRTSGCRVQISDEVAVLLIVDFVAVSSNFCWLPVENNNGMMDGGRDMANTYQFFPTLFCAIKDFLFVEWDVLKVMKEKEKEKGIDREREGKLEKVGKWLVWCFFFLVYFFIDPMKMMNSTKEEAYFLGFLPRELLLTEVLISWQKGFIWQTEQ